MLKAKKWWFIGGGALLLGLIIVIINIITNKETPEAVDKGPSHSLLSLYPQESVAIDGQANLQTDDNYYFQNNQGNLDTIFVTDGQVVETGQSLFSYKQTDSTYEIEDAQRALNRLYTQRQEIQNQIWAGGVSASWGQNSKSTPIATPLNTQTDSTDQSNANADANGWLDSSGSEGVDPSASLKEQLRQINQQIEDAEINLGRLQSKTNQVIKARSSGRVIINRDAETNPNVPLVRIVSEESSVIGTVGEFDFYLLEEGRQVELEVTATGETMKGEILSFDHVPTGSGTSNSSDSGSQDTVASPVASSGGKAQYQFTIKPEKHIQPGFSVTINLTMPGYIVPETAFKKEGNTYYVYVVRDHVAKKIAVKIEKQGKRYAIKNGVREGDLIIEDFMSVQDGDKVEYDEAMYDAKAPADKTEDEGDSSVAPEGQEGGEGNE